MRVLVTGHDGYLGHRVVPLLLASGHDVRGLDTGLYSHRALGPTAPEIPTTDRDVRDVEPEDVAGVDVVIHLAGLSNDPLGDRDPAVTDEVNHRATLRLADLSRRAGVGRFVFASTCSVYGAAGEGVVDESSTPAPVTAYARAKLAAERGLEAVAGDMSVTCLRLGTVFGWAPRLRADLVVNNLVGWAVTTGEVVLRSDGTSWRPLLHVDDAAAAIVAAAARDGDLLVANVTGADGDLQVVEVAHRVAAETGATMRFADGAGPDRRSYRVDGRLLARTLPTTVARTDLDAGISGLVEAYRSHGFTSEDLHVTLRRNAWLDRLAAAGRLAPDLRWTGVVS